MKGSIGNIWLVGIVITFIFIFSAYITVTMNYSKTFKYKNEILSIIETDLTNFSKDIFFIW